VKTQPNQWDLWQIGKYQAEEVRGKPPKEMTGEQLKRGWMLD
jgi:hypothetical protein